MKLISQLALGAALATGAAGLVTAAPAFAQKKDEKKDEDQPFELVDLKLKIPRGSFVAIVGRVGSGKVRLVCTASHS